MEMPCWPSDAPHPPHPLLPHFRQACAVLSGGRGGIGEARSLSYGAFDLGLNPSLILAPDGNGPESSVDVGSIRWHLNIYSSIVGNFLTPGPSDP